MWMSPDPLSEEFPNWSPYNYAFQNPVKNVDPTGLAPEDWVKKNSTWTYDANITTAQQATAAGYDGFKQNGSIISNAKIGENGDSGFVRLNAGGSADYLPNATTQDMVTNNAALFAQWTGEFMNGVKSFFTGGSSENYYTNAGDTATNVGYSGFRPGIDKPIDLGGAFGALLGGFGRSQTLKGNDGRFQAGNDLLGLAGFLNFSSNKIDTANYKMQVWNPGASALIDTTIIWQFRMNNDGGYLHNDFDKSNLREASRVRSISDSRLHNSIYGK
jgi:hypothetical protein